MFGGQGACLTVCNATIGLMLAIQAVLWNRAGGVFPGKDGAAPRYVLMPSFTFAATAQAAVWCGLVPLFCDSRASDWSACPDDEERLIAKYGDRIALIMPYATLGTHIDLDRYEALRRRTGIPVVIDAAASLGSNGPDGKQFATGSALPVVFSMHATKAFATAEGGVIYANDEALIAQMRVMANFGFASPRSSSMPGINAKLSEVHALLALEKLNVFEALMEQRRRASDLYRELLPGWEFQHDAGTRSGCSFMPVLLPHAVLEDRATMISALQRDGIEIAAYFSPHVAQQPFFRNCPRSSLSVADDIAARVLSLPLWDAIPDSDVRSVCDALRQYVPDPHFLTFPIRQEIRA